MQRRLGVALFAGLMLSLASAPAAADCTTSGNTVTCASSGGPQTTPVGTGAEDGLTVNVQSGATVDATGTPGSIAIYLNDNNTVNNAGSVIASSFGAGVSVNNGGTVNNTGSILVGDFATTINACCGNVILNSGTLTAGANAFGLYAADGNTFTNSASGKINVGNDSAAVLVVDGNTIVNHGTIIAGTNGAGISANDGNTITNTGSITVGDGFGSFGIATVRDSTVFNSGTITIGTGGTGVALADNTALPVSRSFTNSGKIEIGDSGTGVIATTNHRVVNSGTISVGANGFGIQVGGANHIDNFGTISSGFAGAGVMLNGLGGAAGNTFNNAGSILSNDAFALFGDSDNTVTNTGLMLGRIFLLGTGNTFTNQGNLVAGDPSSFTFPSGGSIGGTLINDPTGSIFTRVTPTANDNYGADTIVLNGGRLGILVTPGLYENTTVYSTATTGAPLIGGCGCTSLTGTFDSIATSSPFFTATADYSSGNGIDVTLTRLGFGAVPGMSANQRAVGNVLEPGYSTGLTGDLATFYTTLLSANSLGILDQLSGAGTAAAQDSAFSSGSQFGGAMFQQGMSWFNGSNGGNGFGAPLGYAATPKRKLASKPGHDAFAAMPPQQSAPVWRAWTSGFGSNRSLDGQAGTANQSSTTFGGVFGIDRQLTPDLLFGLAAGGSGSHFSASSLSTSGRINSGHIGAYAIQRLGDAYIAGTVNYARGETTTSRTITGLGPTEYAKGKFDSDQLSGRFEIGRKFGFNGYAVTPFAAIEPAALWQRAYTESSTTVGGAPGVLGLSYGANSVTALPLFLGAQIDARYELAGGHILSPFARLSWVHEFKPARSVEASFVTIPGTAFTADGARAAADAVRIETGGTLALSRRAALYLNVASEFSDRSNSIAALGGARLSW